MFHVKHINHKLNKVASTLLALVCVASLSFYLALPASASGNINYTGSLSEYYSSTFAPDGVTYSRAAGSVPISSSSQTLLASYSGSWPSAWFAPMGWSIPSPNISNFDGYNGVILAVSVAYWGTAVASKTEYASLSTSLNSGSVSVSFQDSSGTIRGGSGTVSEFSATAVNQNAFGFTFTGTFPADSAKDLNSLEITVPNTAIRITMPSSGSFTSLNWYEQILNARLVPYSGTADVSDLLLSMTDAIVEQTELMSAFYGDILAMVTKIYERLGDMQETIDKLLPLVQSIDSSLSSIETTTSQIYSFLGTFMATLVSLISKESSDIQQSIADAELAIEEYFKPVIDYFLELEETTGESASSLPGHKSDLDGWSSDSAGISDDANSGLVVVSSILGTFDWVLQIVGLFVGAGVFYLIIKRGMS